MPKKFSLIEEKDRGDTIASILGGSFNSLNNRLKEMEIRQLLDNAGSDLYKWQLKQNENLRKYNSKINREIIASKKQLKREMMRLTATLNLTDEQRIALNNSVMTSVDTLGALSIQNHRMLIQEVAGKFQYVQVKDDILQSQKASELFEVINQRINGNLPRYNVIYKDGKTFKWENYMEMKVRTEIQTEISNSFVDVGKATENVFYVCSTYGDCANDHVDMQAKGIFYEADWESFDIAEPIKEQIRDYIDSKKLMSIEDAMGSAGNYFTTRPNCRHYFQFISIDEVLGIDSKAELQKYRESQNLAFAGKYNQSKYDALKQQRANERAIRDAKGKKQGFETALAEAQKQNASADVIRGIQADIKRQNGRLWGYTDANGKKHQGLFAKQRRLINANPNLDRQYDREQYRALVTDLGANKK